MVSVRFQADDRGAAGRPAWLTVTLLAAGILIGGAFLLRLAAAAARRSRKSGEAYPGSPVKAPPSVRTAGDRASIVLADHDRLIVTHSRADDTICVLRPPDADPAAILAVARLVLREEPYEELASHLGVPASWPLE